jgi:hypothetical protein
MRPLFVASFSSVSTKFNINQELSQLEPKAMKRDLVKALAGFDIEGEEAEHWRNAAVASGNWGCGKLFTLFSLRWRFRHARVQNGCDTLQHPCPQALLAATRT